jgi:hypothetical protein
LHKKESAVPHFTARAAAAAFAFLLGLASVWLSGLPAPAEERVAEWLVPTSGISVPAGPPAAREPNDTQKVYETVLRELYGGGEEGRLIVVHSTTSYYPFTEGHARGLEGVSQEAVEDYLAKGASPKRLPPLPGLSAQVALLDWDEHGMAFRRGRRVGGWEDFHERFPNSASYVEFSAVGFNRAGTLAFLYASKNCGTLCGEGRFVLLEKTPRGWEIAGRQSLWIS